MDKSSKSNRVHTNNIVYVSSTGKRYYPEPITKAKVKTTLQEAESMGFKPSKAYLKLLEKIDIDKFYNSK